MTHFCLIRACIDCALHRSACQPPVIEHPPYPHTTLPRTLSLPTPSLRSPRPPAPFPPRPTPFRPLPLPLPAHAPPHPCHNFKLTRPPRNPLPTRPRLPSFTPSQAPSRTRRPLIHTTSSGLHPTVDSSPHPRPHAARTAPPGQSPPPCPARTLSSRRMMAAGTCVPLVRSGSTAPVASGCVATQPPHAQLICARRHTRACTLAHAPSHARTPRVAEHSASPPTCVATCAALTPTRLFPRRDTSSTRVRPTAKMSTWRVTMPLTQGGFPRPCPRPCNTSNGPVPRRDRPRRYRDIGTGLGNIKPRAPAPPTPNFENKEEKKKK